MTPKPLPAAIRDHVDGCACKRCVGLEACFACKRIKLDCDWCFNCRRLVFLPIPTRPDPGLFVITAREARP